LVFNLFFGKNLGARDTLAPLPESNRIESLDSIRFGAVSRVSLARGLRDPQFRFSLATREIRVAREERKERKKGKKGTAVKLLMLLRIRRTKVKLYFYF